MRSLVFAAALALAAVSGVAFAQTDPNSAPVPIQEGTAVVQEDGSVAPGAQANDGRPNPDSEVICRVVQETGSRLARRRQRVCGTRTMWEQMEDQNARDIRGLGQVQGESGG